ncbi:MAG: hypothetical protein WDN31_11165 [Hyphomicrobium sp.]
MVAPMENHNRQIRRGQSANQRRDLTDGAESAGNFDPLAADLLPAAEGQPAVGLDVGIERRGGIGRQADNNRARRMGVHQLAQHRAQIVIRPGHHDQRERARAQHAVVILLGLLAELGPKLIQILADFVRTGRRHYGVLHSRPVRASIALDSAGPQLPGS